VSGYWIVKQQVGTRESKMLKTREIRIKAPSGRDDMVISVELFESKIQAKTEYELDAEKIVDAFWRGLPDKTVRALICLLIEAQENADFGWWTSFKKKKGWIK